ncbi:DUF3180 family protein [Demequina capsici]|uniref:DUF3180 family protein n=1 Tax=Demequina capsici TaxID=3075620 RepID=A0AA96FA29_9MICO|nr:MULTISPECIES: DUF3180 family protein [unclassified Demequina]WNM24926.1 DUF3180 family protein [Demequina sp. OYTSA14]WNM27833.1 DUF3180 family protein [Demequina sp. PMTSA13]
MTPLTWRRLALWVGVSVLLAWGAAALLLARGQAPVAVPLSLPIGCLIAGGIAIAWGWTVRAYQRGHRHHVDPMKALRTVAFAQACAYSGAVLGGGLGGYALALTAYWDHAPRRSIAIEALIAAAAAVAMLVAGVIAERWCRIDDDGDQHDAGPGAGAGAAPA